MLVHHRPRRGRLACASPSSRALQAHDQHFIKMAYAGHLDGIATMLISIQKPYHALTLSSYPAVRPRASSLAPYTIVRCVPYLPNPLNLYYIYTSCSTPIPHLVVVPVPAIVSTAKKFITGFSFLLSALKMSWANSPPRMAAVGANS
jgi:hypothetical protein